MKLQEEPFEKQFSWPILTVDLPFIVGGDSIQVDMEAVCLLKIHGTAGSDELSSAFLKDSGNVLTSKTKNLFGSIWLKEMSESVIVPI